MLNAILVIAAVSALAAFAAGSSLLVHEKDTARRRKSQRPLTPHTFNRLRAKGVI